MPIATRTTLGVIKVGNNLSITQDGTLSATGGGGGGGGSIFYTQTLTQGNIEVTFTGLPTSGDYVANIYASNGSDYKSLDLSSLSTEGQIIITYNEQNQDIIIYLKLEEVTT